MIRKTSFVFTFLIVIYNYSFSQVVTATQTDSLVGDHQTIGIANPNDTVRYKTTISVSGATANGVNFNNPIPTNTTQVGTVKTSALCRDDVFATSFNTLLNTGNVLSNDYGLPSVSVVSFGTTMSGGTTTMAGNVGTTNGGGNLTVNANGTFSYQPMMGFSGMDQFTYICTTGVAGLQNGIGIVTINVATDILFTTIDVNPLCNGTTTGSIMFMASGGTGSLMYSITGAMGSYQASPSFAGLSAGTYNLAVKDAANYIKTGTTTLTDPALITFTTMNVDNVCNGDLTGSITFNASGGTGALTYSITGSMGSYQMSPAFTGLAANTYNLAVKDANNCIVTGTTTITQPTAVTFTFTKTDITCNGAGDGSIVFNTTMGGSSPYTYSINGTMGTFSGTTNFTGLSANTYNLVAKDNLGCNSAVQSTTVLEPAAIVVSGTIPNLTYNIGSNVTFTKTGGTGSPANPWSGSGFPTGVSINTSSGVVSGIPTQTGMFTATIIYTDANGCTDDIMVSFNVAPRLLNESFAVVGNTQLVSNGHSTPTTPHTTSTTNILTNDQSDAAISVTAGTFATVNGGSITIGTDGKFIFSPLAGSTASDSYVYTGTSNGVSATATITFNISNMVWYVNNTFMGSADGRSHAPFTTCSAAATASAINQTIYVHTGTGNTTGNSVLKSGQTLRGAGNALTIGALTIPAGTKPTLSNTITLANSVTVDGFDMSTGLGVTALSSSGATSVNVNIGNVATVNPNNSVTITNTTGSVSIAGGGMVGGGGATINISGGSVNFTYGGNVNQGTSNHPMVNITGGHTGTVTFNTGTLSATNGTGLQFDNADGTYNFSGTVTLNGGDAGIDILNGSVGTFSFANTNITRANSISGAAFNLLSSDANITYNGNITLGTSTGNMIAIDNHDAGTLTFATGNYTKGSSTTQGISIQNCNGGSIIFNNPTTSITMTSGNAISLTNNTGATISLLPTAGGNGIDLTTTSGIGFNATGGGTINVTGTGNSITSTTGTALNVSSTTIGASNINFQSISANGAANGIVLNNTGTSGGLKIMGTGSAGSGGTIQNCTTYGISLATTRLHELNYMIIQNSGDDGIYGENVNSLTLTNCQILNNGNSVNTDCGIDMGGSGIVSPVGSAGTITISNSTITGNYSNQIFIGQSSGTATLSLTGSTVTGSTNNDNNDGILLSPQGTSTINSTISSSNFSANKGDHIQIAGVDSGGGNIVINGNTFTGGHPTGLGQGITISAATGAPGYGGTITYDVNGNNINGAISNSVSVVLGTSSDAALFSGHVRNNIIGTSSVSLSGSTQANGVYIDARGNGTHTSAVTGNTIRQCFDRGILTESGDGNTPNLNLTVQSNVIDQQVDPMAREAIQTNFGITSTNVFGGVDAPVVCLQLGGAGPLANTFSHGAGAPDDFRLRKRQNATVSLPGYAGGTGQDAGSLAQVVAFIQGQNTGSAGEPGSAAASGGGGGYTGGPTCPLP